MTTMTRTRIPTWQVPAIDARAAELNFRFHTREIPGTVTVAYTDPYVVRDDLGIEHTFVDVTIDVTANALPGGWALTAIGDFQLGDTPIITRFDDDTTPITQATTTIITEDGKALHAGDRAFNYYDRKWGHIAEPPDYEGWFEFRHDDGTTALLNGQRIATYDPR